MEKEDSDVVKKREPKGAEEGEAAREIICKGERKTCKIDATAEERRRLMEEYAKWKREKEAARPAPDPELLEDFYAFQARPFKKWWTEIYRWDHGSFNDETKIPCKCFTNNPGGRQRDTLQDPCLVDARSCPCCRFVWLCRPSSFVGGTTESEDKEISLLAVQFRSNLKPFESILIKEHSRSRLTTLEFALGHIVRSVEATICVEIIHGSWPAGFCGQFAARTAEIDKRVVLLDSGDEGLLVTGDEVKLSRRVVSVEYDGKLMVSVKALQGDKVFLAEIDFTPQQMGTCCEILDIGPCRMKVTVAWSLLALF